jgi:hypothetical protein
MHQTQNSQALSFTKWSWQLSCFMEDTPATINVLQASKSVCIVISINFHAFFMFSKVILQLLYWCSTSKMDSDIPDSDLCDSFIVLSHKQQHFAVHDTYKWILYFFICFKYTQSVEKHGRILKNKIQIQFLKSSMNRENLFKEYHERSNCEGLRSSKILCQYTEQWQFLNILQSKLKSFFLKFLKSRRFHNLEMLQT